MLKCFDKTNRILVYILLIVVAFPVQACGKYKAYSKPIIEETDEWGIAKRCLYQSCTHKFETIKSKDIEIMIIANNGLSVDNIFTIKLLFYTPKKDYYFDPSGVKITFNNKEVFAKGLRCSDTYHDLRYLRSGPHLTGKTIIKDNDCIVLFFDMFPPTIDQEFQLLINGLATSNKEVQIPIISFKQEIHKGNWGETVSGQ